MQQSDGLARVAEREQRHLTAECAHAFALHGNPLRRLSTVEGVAAHRPPIPPATTPRTGARPRSPRRSASRSTRSSAASGDSGDDGPGEPAPTLHPAARRLAGVLS